MDTQGLNDKNFDFYNKIGVDSLMELAIRGGFSTHRDLEVVEQFIKNEDSILELGAGYGRCLDYLLVKGHTGPITAIEQSQNLMNYLQKRYGQRVSIIKGDLKIVDAEIKVDVALWMWSGILDFSREEQLEVITKIFGWLNPGGRLIIDVPKIGFKTIADHTDEQHIKLHSPYGDMECYIPSHSDIEQYASNAGFINFDEIHYDTVTEKQRTIFVMKKGVMGE